MKDNPKLKLLLKKKNFSNEDISFLSSLSKDSIENLTESLSLQQVEKIYEILSTPKVSNWIDSTVKIHKSNPKLKQTLPEMKEQKDYRQIVEMIMVSAGDFLVPNIDTVEAVYQHIKKYVRAISKLKKKTLRKRFFKVLDKYKPGLKSKLKINQEEESLSDLENSQVDIKNIERLKFNDLRTSLMNEDQYLKFSECRKILFSKFGKNRFLAWSHANSNYKFLGWIAREKIFEIVEKANRSRNNGILDILESALQVHELDLNES